MNSKDMPFGSGYLRRAIWPVATGRNFLMLMGTSLKTRAVAALLWVAFCTAGALTGAAQVQPPEPAPVMVWNHQVAVFRTIVGGLSSSKRGSAAVGRLR